jgi:predicted RNA-binding Zn-ribbon protein involved in translation (DUF1610 family)
MSNLGITYFVVDGTILCEDCGNSNKDVLPEGSEQWAQESRIDELIGEKCDLCGLFFSPEQEWIPLQELLDNYVRLTCKECNHVSYTCESNLRDNKTFHCDNCGKNSMRPSIETMLKYWIEQGSYYNRFDILTGHYAYWRIFMHDSPHARQDKYGKLDKIFSASRLMPLCIEELLYLESSDYENAIAIFVQLVINDKYTGYTIKA